MRRFEEIDGVLVEVFNHDYKNEQQKLNVFMDKQYYKWKKVDFLSKKAIKLLLIFTASIIFLYISIFTHEFFHMITIIYFGVDEVEYYVYDKGGHVKFIWNRDDITKEELLISLIAGSLFNIILYLLIMIYFYSKDKDLTLIPIPIIIKELYNWYFYREGSDRHYFIDFHPKIDVTLVNNLFYGILILTIIVLAMFVIRLTLDILNEYSKIN